MRSSRTIRKKIKKRKRKPSPRVVPIEKSKGGRPTKMEPRFIADAEKFAALGLSQRDMAFIWNIDPDTVTNWKQRVARFSDALKRGDARKRLSLLAAMMKNATLLNNAAAQIFLAKNWLGMRDRQELDIGVPGEMDDGRVILEIVHTGRRADPPKVEAEAKESIVIGK